MACSPGRPFELNQWARGRRAVLGGKPGEGVSVQGRISANATVKWPPAWRGRTGIARRGKARCRGAQTAADAGPQAGRGLGGRRGRGRVHPGAEVGRLAVLRPSPRKRQGLARGVRLKARAGGARGRAPSGPRELSCFLCFFKCFFKYLKSARTHVLFILPRNSKIFRSWVGAGAPGTLRFPLVFEGFRSVTTISPFSKNHGSGRN